MSKDGAADSAGCVENEPFRKEASVSCAQDALCEIRAFRRLGERFATAGQPTAEQLRLVKEAGCEAVINLALPTSDNALPDEGSITTGLGMAYAHLPVNFDAPSDEDFRRFRKVLGAFDGCRVFVHCAANMRVSAFMYLYRVLHAGVDQKAAESDLLAIWTPDEVWQAFIDRQLAVQTSREDG